MAEYIERDKTLQDMHGSHSTPIFIGHKTDEDIMFERMCGIVMEQPTADVVEVRHGEWLQTKEPLGWNDVDCIECSACHDSWILGEEFDLEDYKYYWKYCPNCGARMEGE